MSVLDIIIIVVVLIGFILGYKDGFVRKIIGLVGFALGIYLAIKFSVELGRAIERIFGIEFYLSQIIAGITIFFLIILVFAIIKRLVHPFDKVNNLINQLLGGFFGAIQILFFLSAVFFLLNVFNVPSKESAQASMFYKKVYSILPATVNYISNYTPKTKEIIKDYINNKDTTL